MQTPDFDARNRFLIKLWKADTPRKLNKLLADELAGSLPVRSTALILRSAPAVSAAVRRPGMPVTYDDLSAGLRGKRSPSKIGPAHPDYEKLSPLLGRGTAVIYAVPLIGDGSTIGVFLAGTDKKRGFSAREMKTLAAFGKMASTATCLSPLGGLCVAHAPWDAETATYNHAFFDAMLGEEIKRADRDNHDFCLFHLRLAGYGPFRKKRGAGRLRDALGHVVNSLRAKLRDHDIVGRIDNETFAVILPGIGAVTGKSVANRILRDISRLSVGGAARKGTTLAPAIGIAVYPEHASFKTVLVEAAEMAVETAVGRKKATAIVFS